MKRRELDLSRGFALGRAILQRGERIAVHTGGHLTGGAGERAARDDAQLATGALPRADETHRRLDDEVTLELPPCKVELLGRTAPVDARARQGVGLFLRVVDGVARELWATNILML